MPYAGQATFHALTNLRPETSNPTACRRHGILRNGNGRLTRVCANARRIRPVCVYGTCNLIRKTNVSDLSYQIQ
jgi:hypothetical protein